MIAAGRCSVVGGGGEEFLAPAGGGLGGFGGPLHFCCFPCGLVCMMHSNWVIGTIVGGVCLWWEWVGGLEVGLRSEKFLDYVIIIFVGVSFIGDHSGVSVFGFWDGFFFFFLVWVLE